jgi:dCTP diphosphatase
MPIVGVRIFQRMCRIRRELRVRGETGMSDATTSIEDLKQSVARFVRERDWEQFHSPKNIAVSIAIEAAELMEIYQWGAEGKSLELSGKAEVKAKVDEELADVLIYCLSLANRTAIDVSQVVQRKLARNAVKYPVDQFRGRY